MKTEQVVSSQNHKNSFELINQKYCQVPCFLKSIQFSRILSLSTSIKWKFIYKSKIGNAYSEIYLWIANFMIVNLNGNQIA